MCEAAPPMGRDTLATDRAQTPIALLQRRVAVPPLRDSRSKGASLSPEARRAADSVARLSARRFSSKSQLARSRCRFES